MSVTIEQDLKEILAKIDQKIDQIDERLNKIENGQTRLESELKKIEEKISASTNQLKIEIEKVEQKIDGLDKRPEFQEFINRGVLIGFIIAILGGLAKIFGFVTNP